MSFKSSLNRIMTLSYTLNSSNINEEQGDFDPSEYPFPREIWSIRPGWEVVLKVATLGPIALLGIVGNSGLVRAILGNRALRSSSSSNLLILNTALADLGTSLLCPWLFIGVDVFQNYVFGPVGCKLDGFLQNALTLVAVLSLSAVSYDRVCSVAGSFFGRLSIGRAKLLIFASWIVALGVTVSLAFFRQYYERQWKNYLETFCAEQKIDFPYWHLFVGLSVCTPLLIMAVCYSIILVKLSRYEKQALKRKIPIAMNYKGKVARILALVVLAFIICRVPFTLLVIQRARLNSNFNSFRVGQAESMYALWYISRYLVFVNAALNPLLYGYTSGSLRRELASYPLFSWIIRARQLKRSEQPHQEVNSKIRPPCIKMGEALPNLSSIVQSRNADGVEVRLYKKLRFNS